MGKPLKKIPTSIWTNPIHFIACGFGIGALPVMPGTYATLAAVPLYWALSHLSIGMYLLIVLLLNLAGIYLCGKTNRDFGTQDHPAAVWDEIAAFPIVMIGIAPSWYAILLGVVLFRFFDIVKPGPIGWIDRNVHGGLGVMLDDVVAALFALVCLQIILYFI